MSQVKNLQFRQGSFELLIPQMEILESGVTALTGPSGSGKSTLVRLLLGLESTKGWNWIFKGRDVAALSVRERNFGVVFQTLDLFPHMTAFENVHFIARCRIPDHKEQLKHSQFVLDRLGLSSIQNQKPGELSGGERQRVALARALVSRPDFLILDEPFSSLDANTQMESRRLVKEILSEQKIPALLISHDVDDVKSLADLVHRMEHGKILLPHS